MSEFTSGLVVCYTPVSVSSSVGSVSLAMVGTVVGMALVGTVGEFHDTYDCYSLSGAAGVPSGVSAVTTPAGDLPEGSARS